MIWPRHYPLQADPFSSSWAKDFVVQQTGRITQKDVWPIPGFFFQAAMADTAKTTIAGMPKACNLVTLKIRKLMTMLLLMLEFSLNLTACPLTSLIITLAMLSGPCLVHPEIQKVFKIPRHIESCGTCMKH